MVTNIVENFKNPMSSERRMKIYGKNLFESMAEKGKDNFIDADLRTVKPVPVRQETDNRTYKERLNSYLDVEYFSAGALKKLNSAGLFKAMDIISIGADAFKERFGLRTFKAARSFLDANRLDFSGSHRIPTISEHSLEGMSPDELGKVKERDLVNSLSNIPDNVISRQIRMPRNSVGQYFSGADCISLIAKSVSIPRWRDCNIFLSKEELDSLRLVVNRGAIPCHIADIKGKPITVYNLSETDFATSYPSMFDALSDMSRNTSAEVPAYVKNLIYGYSGIGLADASKVYQRFNQGYANNVDMEQLGPQSMSVKELAGHSARKLGIKNPLERRGRKARPKDVLKGMEHSMKNGKGNVVKHRK